MLFSSELESLVSRKTNIEENEHETYGHPPPPPPPHSLTHTLSSRLTAPATLLVALMLGLALTLPMTTYAQANSCPPGVTQLDDLFLSVALGQNRGSTYNPETHQFTTDTTKHSATVTVIEQAKNLLANAKGYTSGYFRFGMQGGGENLLHHGVFWSAGRLHNSRFSEIDTPIHFHNLEPGTKYAVSFHIEKTNLHPERRLVLRKCFQTPTPAP